MLELSSTHDCGGVQLEFNNTNLPRMSHLDRWEIVPSIQTRFVDGQLTTEVADEGDTVIPNEADGFLMEIRVEAL